MGLEEDFGLIVVGGGSSRRFGAGNKLLLNVQGVPLFVHTLRRFSAHLGPDRLVMVIPRAERAVFEEAARRFLPERAIVWADGGDTRSESVRNGLAALRMTSGFVGIHDAARPLADWTLTKQLLTRAREVGGAIPAKPVTDTLKQTDASGIITATVSREGLWRVETPQLFDLHKLRNAYQQTPDSFTDDAGTMAAAGYAVAIVHNPAPNPKLTYAAEVTDLEHLLEKNA